MRQKAIWAIAVLVISLFWFVPEAYTEPYVAGYGGISLAKDSDFNFDNFGLRLQGPLLAPFNEIDLFSPAPGSRPTKVSNSAVFGGKVGYWFDALPLIGTEIDIYTFRPDLKINIRQVPFPSLMGLSIPFSSLELDVSVVTIGFSVMGRYPFLKSPPFPRGRLQPYAGFGPAIFITKLKDKEPESGNNLGSKTTAAGGVQVLAGVKFFIINRLSLFAEYKFTHHTAQFGGQAPGGAPFPGVSGLTEGLSVAGSQSFNVNHFSGGLAWHFY